MDANTEKRIRDKRIKRNKKLMMLALAFPFIAVVIMFFYVPIAGWALSFFNYKPGIPFSKTPFTGFDNFRLIYDNRREITRVLINTFTLGFLNILTSPLAVLFALLLNEVRTIRFKKLVQITTTIPHFVSWVIIFSLGFAIFSNEGMLNNLFLRTGVLSKPYNILTDIDNVWPFQTALSVWKSLGWNTIIYIAAIAGIDEELYGAAKVDGAGRFYCAVHITFPGVLPTFVVLLLLTISNILGMGFEQYFVFNNTLVVNRLEVLDLYLYRIGITTFDYSYAVAIGMLKSFFSIALLFTANYLANRLRGDPII